MCGICGVTTKTERTPALSTVIDMLRRMRHRGPDGCGVFAAGTIHHAASVDALDEAVVPVKHETPTIVAQSRLAITGSQEARQPFISADGRIALVHNGEAYNHKVLASVAGVQVATGCDSEVLMRVLEQHHASTGDLTEAVRRTVAVSGGMYALAVTDGTTLVLARDAVGKKPLYFVDGPTAFAFASERKGLAEIARAQQADIVRLKPGGLLTLKPGGPIVLEQAEWLSPPAIDIHDPEFAVDAYEAALDRAITRRIGGLSRAAVYFSGGVDSVLVARLLQRAGVDVTGYVAGMAGSSDVEHAVAVAHEMQLPLNVSTVDAETVAGDLPAIVAASELHGPLQVEVSIPMWYAAKAAHADGHKVVFSGQAADELFGGYDWYRGVYANEGALELHHRLWEDIRALPLDTLEREDRISMAWSLEARCPFLDPDVIRVAMRMSPHLKVHGASDTQRKHPHRAVALRAGVPDSIAYREKIPAQDGANVHELLQSVAEAHFPHEVVNVPLPDFGSNYRYRDDLRTYGSAKVFAMLARIVADGGLVVARQDGTARVPTAPSRGAAMTATL